MSSTDYLVLGGYFGILILIGIISSYTIKRQEDYFLGGRTFGKLLQTFAAFGAGTGSQDPIALGRTTWTSGLSGIWAALCWLFATPFYWIFAVWYRRMRHLTLGDWFVERYQSKPMGVAYTMFAFAFQILYLSVMFSAISKVVEPLIGEEAILKIVSFIGSENPDHLKYILVPTIGIVVLLYGILGGLKAAYWTDLLQGLGIIVLSLVLIPFGLEAIVDQFGSEYPELMSGGRKLTMADGFTIMHDRISPDFFQLFDTPQSGEFPIHYIIALVMMSLLGIVIQPHFIAVGGGSAKNEFSARVGLVSGNFLKRLCTVGWSLTALIAFALFAGSQELAADPDRVWGVASREILSPLKMGLVGLMVACLLSALMSSADTYMLVSSALLVRNVYAAYVNPNASEKAYLMIGRIAGGLIIVGSVLVSISAYNVFSQYVLALEVAASFAAPFWIGMYWRGATKWAAWLTVLFSVGVFFVAPIVIPMVEPDLKTQREYLVATQVKTITTTRPATPVDVARRQAEIQNWEEAQERLDEARAEFTSLLAELTDRDLSASELEVFISEQPKLQVADAQVLEAEEELEVLGEKQAPLIIGRPFRHQFQRGGDAIFWSGGLVNRDTGEPASQLAVIGEEYNESKDIETTTSAYNEPLQGVGRFNVEFLAYREIGVDLSKLDRPTLETLRVVLKIATPFLLMVIFSWVTPGCKKVALDRYYAKMKVEVDADPEIDQRNLEEAYANPAALERLKLFPGSSFEVQRPRPVDVIGFLVCVAICIGFIQLILFVSKIGA